MTRMKIFVSRFRSGPVLDMESDGSFRQTGSFSLSQRVAAFGLIAAVVAGGLAIAMLALWLALALIPIALGAALVAWGAWRFNVWRNGGSLRRQSDIMPR